MRESARDCARSVQRMHVCLQVRSCPARPTKIPPRTRDTAKHPCVAKSSKACTPMSTSLDNICFFFRNMVSMPPYRRIGPRLLVESTRTETAGRCLNSPLESSSFTAKQARRMSYACIHTYIHTHIHKYIQTNIHAYIH